jgi:tRNA(fMet)-specific endonuclease VapC
MTYIWDTNILVYAVRNPLFLETLYDRYDLSNSLNKSYISAVTLGEIRAIAFRNRWGQKKTADLERLLPQLGVIAVTDDNALIKMYAEIDVYSQSQHPTLRLPTSARKMGKNDLWIAATTAIYNATLLSTDADFTHLDGLFLAFEKIIA